MTLLLVFNQAILKITNQAIQPVFFARLRSALAVVFGAGWQWARERPLGSVPVWLALMAHWGLPGERLPLRAAGLAFAGTA
ncbi:MAG: hypothetical protein WCC57_01285 [Paracoccaceae bacterium]